MAGSTVFAGVLGTIILIAFALLLLAMERPQPVGAWVTAQNCPAGSTQVGGYGTLGYVELACAARHPYAITLLAAR